MALLAYFKKSKPSKDILPSPTGPLSLTIQSSCIEAANKRVAEELQRTSEASAAESGAKSTKRGMYQKYTPQEKAEISSYAAMHGTTAAIRRFKDRFPQLKWTTVNDWKKAMAVATKNAVKSGESVKIDKLEEKKRGRPSILSDAVTTDIKRYITTLRDAGGVVNTRIVIAAATGILQRKDPSILRCNGGHIDLQKSWAKYLLKKMDFVKRRATTKHVTRCENFDTLKEQYLFDVQAVAEMESIPDSLIINWDQTGINYVPVSEWSMAKEGSKRVEVTGFKDKRQITAVFAGAMSGDFLPVQLVYQGKTSRCLPTVDFPCDWHLTFSANHWCNESTMVDYVNMIILPYVNNKRKELSLDQTYPALVIFDEFNGQTTDTIFDLLATNNIYYVIVPPNCTDKLQPLDVSVNKPAKDFLRHQFQTWYAEQICSQENPNQLEPVSLKLQVMKPLGARWMIQLYDHMKSHPEIIVNGFKASGIYNSIKC